MSPAEAECPRCRAQLDVETLAQSRATTCPFCEADVSAILAGWQPAEAEQAEFGESPSTGDSGAMLRPLPEGSRLRVVQSGGDQLVVFIPSGGSGAKALWWFALFFTIVLAFFTMVFLMALAAPGQRVQGNPLVAYLVLGLFWLIALGLGWMAVRLKFAQTLLAVDPQRLVLKTILFGRSRQQELSLANGGECGLREAYSVNDVPVYAAEVWNGEDSIRFGTNLSPEDKDWLVNEIQHRLGATGPGSGSTTTQAMWARHDSPATNVTPDKGRAPPNEPSEEVTSLLPSQLPPDTPICLVEETPQSLVFWFPLMPNRLVRVLVPGLKLAFMGLWMAGVGGIAWQRGGGLFGGLGRVMPLLMLALGMLPIAGALFLAFGRSTVRLTRDEFLCRWSLGPFGRQWTLPVSEIEGLSLTRDAAQPRSLFREHPRHNRSKGATGGIVMATPSRVVVVAPIADSSFSRQVAGLLKQKFESWGQQLPVEWVNPVRSESG